MLMRQLLSFALIHCTAFYGCEKKQEQPSTQENTLAYPSNDPCGHFKTQRTCNLMSMHDSVRRVCQWTRSDYYDSGTKTIVENEACISAP